LSSNHTFQQIEDTLHHLASPKRSHTFWGMVLVLIVVSGLLWSKHGGWISHPNDNYLMLSPDGFKNYMTTAWHVRHDSTLVHYRGMNYPYGEHSLFTDNQPIFSSALQWWHRKISDIGISTVGIINISQLISILLGCAILFLLLRKLHLPVWYAGLVTIGLTFLSPQYHRFDGHFGLSHTFVITGLLYLLCCYEERKSKRYQSLQIGALVWFASQLHFYYLGLALLFLSLYLLFQVMSDFTWDNIKARFSHWLVMLILPYALLNIWIHWADFHTDRPATPYGFTSYIGFWEGIFLPYEEFPLHQWINKNITKIRTVDGETKAYSGVLVFLFTLGLILSGLFRRIKNVFTLRPFHFSHLLTGLKIYPTEWDNFAHHRVQKQYLRGIFTAAFLLLLFSCGFPFAIKSWEWTANYFGPLRQFRGLGRFTWVFFYVANIAVFYSIYHHSQLLPRKWFKNAESKGIPILKNLMLFLPLCILGYESFTFQKIKKLQLSENTEIKAILTEKPNSKWLEKVDFAKYQALLPLPYYHMGSENIWLDIDFGLFIRTQLTAFHTGVPDMGVNMSRTSVGQTVKSVQLTLEPGEIPAIIQDFPDSRPLALMVQPEKWEEVQKRYKHLVSKAKLLYSSDQVRVMELPIDSLLLAVKENQIAVKKEMESRKLYGFGTWRSTQPKKDFYYQSFDSLPQPEHAFRGKGAYKGVMSDTTWLYNAQLPKGNYSISVWCKATLDMGMNNEMKIIDNKKSDGTELKFKHEGLRFYLKQIVGDWGLFEVNFDVHSDESHVRIFMQKKGVDNPFYIDDVVIKPINTEIYRNELGWVVRNNFWYKD
jgi:hypothetical protein